MGVARCSLLHCQLRAWRPHLSKSSCFDQVVASEAVFTTQAHRLYQRPRNSCQSHPFFHRSPIVFRPETTRTVGKQIGSFAALSLLAMLALKAQCEWPIASKE